KAIANTQWNNYVKELQDLHGCTFEDAAAKLKAEFEIVEKTEGGKEYAKYSQLAFERLCLPPKSI
ncbi:MAG TPA: hypothetical protein VK826_12460, partial [Bacteroidia bacterium]|nr:hypothetical protein [Bacteroidia bacterium]